MSQLREPAPESSSFRRCLSETFTIARSLKFSNGSGSLAFIAFRDVPTFSIPKIRAYIEQAWPGESGDAAEREPTGEDSDDGVRTFNVGVVEVSFMTSDAPIPWGDLEGPCRTDDLWPDAAGDLRSHKAHSAVFVRGKFDLVAAASHQTHVIAATLATTETALGVYWGSASMVIRKDIFIEMARASSSTSLPVFLWVDFRVWQATPQSSRAFTVGLAALGHMELEVESAPEDPEQLTDRLSDLALYLLEKGPVVKDGNTVGRDPGERIRVVYAKSIVARKEKVMRLVFGDASPRKPWWKVW